MAANPTTTLKEDAATARRPLVPAAANGKKVGMMKDLQQVIDLMGPDGDSHTGTLGEMICPSCFTFETIDPEFEVASVLALVPKLPASAKAQVLNFTPSHVYYSFAASQCEVLMERAWRADYIQLPEGSDPDPRADTSASAYRATMKGPENRERVRKSHVPFHLARQALGASSETESLFEKLIREESDPCVFDNEMDVYTLFMSTAMQCFDVSAILRLASEEFFSRCAAAAKSSNSNCPVDVVMRRLTPLPVASKKKTAAAVGCDIYCHVSPYNETFLKTVVTPIQAEKAVGAFELRGVDGVCGYALGMFVFEVYSALFRRVTVAAKWFKLDCEGNADSVDDDKLKRLEKGLSMVEPFDVAEWQATRLKTKGNEAYIKNMWDVAMAIYHEAICATPLHSSLRAVCLVNRATTVWGSVTRAFESTNADDFGHFLEASLRCEKLLYGAYYESTNAISVDPLYWKAYHRRMTISILFERIFLKMYRLHEDFSIPLPSAEERRADGRQFATPGSALMAAVADAAAVIQYAPELRDKTLEAILPAIDEYRLALHVFVPEDAVCFTGHATLRLFSSSVLSYQPIVNTPLLSGLPTDLLQLLGFVKPHPAAVAVVNMLQSLQPPRLSLTPRECMANVLALPAWAEGKGDDTPQQFGQRAVLFRQNEFGPASPWGSAVASSTVAAPALAKADKKGTDAKPANKPTSAAADSGSKPAKAPDAPPATATSAAPTKGDTTAAKPLSDAQQKKKEAAEAEAKKKAEEKRKMEDKAAKLEEKRRAEEEKKKAEEAARQKQRERDREEAAKKKEAQRKLREEQEAKRREDDEAAFRRLVELEAQAAVEEELRLKRESEEAARAKAEAKSQAKSAKKAANKAAATTSPNADKPDEFPAAPATTQSAADAADDAEEEAEIRRLEEEARRLREIAEAKRRAKETGQTSAAAKTGVVQQPSPPTVVKAPVVAPAPTKTPPELAPVTAQHSSPQPPTTAATPPVAKAGGIPLPRSAQHQQGNNASPPSTTTVVAPPSASNAAVVEPPSSNATVARAAVPLPRSQRSNNSNAAPTKGDTAPTPTTPIDKTPNSKSPPAPAQQQGAPAASTNAKTVAVAPTTTPAVAATANLLAGLVPSVRVQGPTIESKGKRFATNPGNLTSTVSPASVPAPAPNTWQEQPSKSTPSMGRQLSTGSGIGGGGFTVTAQDDNMESTSRQLSGVSVTNDSVPTTPNTAFGPVLKGRIKPSQSAAPAPAPTFIPKPQPIGEAPAPFVMPTPPAVVGESSFTVSSGPTRPTQPSSAAVQPTSPFLFDTSGWTPAAGSTTATTSAFGMFSSFPAATVVPPPQPKNEAPALWSQAQPLLKLNNTAAPTQSSSSLGADEFDFLAHVKELNFGDLM